MAVDNLLDNIDVNLLEEKDKVLVHQQYGLVKSATINADAPSKTPGPAQDVDGFITLVRRAVQHAETIGKVVDERKMMFTQDFSLKSFNKDIISH